MAALRATSAHVVALDARFGGRDLMGTAVRAAHAGRTAHTRFAGSRGVPAAAAEDQQIAGWIAFDDERQDLSRQMSLEALLTARATGNRSMEQYILGRLAMRDVHIHRPTEAAQICRAALDDGAPGAARTMFTLRAARAAAQMGEDTPALDLIEETRSRHLEGPRTHDPAWAWWLTEAEIAWHHAMIYTDTGRWDRAIERFTAACERPDEYAWASRISQASLREPARQLTASD
ncbi:DNA-binding protein [Actinomadura citrea]|uniref:Uncharacterized protein n=1 Tax=Actinomadura citrea TaxID=46158 RepID=A0A7Y9GB37_9ACTN|nr:DNA-binding protein [Actinomadura citrea]NYE13201.1 hypothetical protein [Actinomadura citrea]GGU04691.1 hypothetical protein GCM10010177_74960 [Actinomadura citrea]